MGGGTEFSFQLTTDIQKQKGCEPILLTCTLSLCGVDAPDPSHLSSSGVTLSTEAESGRNTHDSARRDGLTTIADPAVLEGYCANFAAHGHLDQIQIIVIPDQKTPSTVFVRCAELRKKGLDVLCPLIEQQERSLRCLGFPPELVPYNSDNRRNVGYLMAAESGADFLISIDDDNYCPTHEDYFAEHSVVCGGSQRCDVVESNNGWYNLCELLELEPASAPTRADFRILPGTRRRTLETQSQTAAVRINAGMWLRDPDLDGITWLAAPVLSRAFKGKSIVLGERTWSPVNSQNTALHRDVIPAYYFCPWAVRQPEYRLTATEIFSRLLQPGMRAPFGAQHSRGHSGRATLPKRTSLFARCHAGTAGHLGSGRSAAVAR